ncbi:pilus assembly protein [Chitinimonas sp. JJ19]|uniref:pilus assembly protein n=1 Tax=Chitinimonas sp. JJ19 TaxID=3109352 RepID=UPI0030025F24
MSDSKSYATKALVAILALCQVVSVEAVVPPLGNTPLNQTSSVEPNLMFVYDTSGSMAWSFVPDHSSLDGNTLNSANVVPGTVGYKNHMCNTLAFNPLIDYQPPYRADGVLFPQVNFGAAPYEGLRPTMSSGTNTVAMPHGGTGSVVNLATEYFGFDVVESALNNVNSNSPLVSVRRGNNNSGSSTANNGNTSIGLVASNITNTSQARVQRSAIASPNWTVRVLPETTGHGYQVNDIVIVHQPLAVAGLYRVTAVSTSGSDPYFEFQVPGTVPVPTTTTSPAQSWLFQEAQSDQLYVFGASPNFNAYIVMPGVRARMLDGYRKLEITTSTNNQYNGVYDISDINFVNGFTGFIKFPVTTNFLPGTNSQNVGAYYKVTEIPSEAHYFAYTGPGTDLTFDDDVCKEAPSVSVVLGKKVLGNSTNFTYVKIPGNVPGSTNTRVKNSEGVEVSLSNAVLTQRFANWFSYYRRRSMLMKSAVSTAFNSVDDSFRVGFLSINAAPNQITTAGNAMFRPVDKFSGTVRTNWYETLFASGENYSTPLREALAGAGRYFGNKYNTTVVDPMYTSDRGGLCQKNFTILSTDGQWNNTTPNPLNCNNCAVGLNGTPGNNTDSVFDADGNSGPVAFAPYRLRSDGVFDGRSVSGMLADIALHYYAQDIRPDLSNEKFDTTKPAPFQNMVTHTIGLGLTGRLAFTSDYKTSTAADNDFYRIKQGVATCSAAGGGTGSSVCNWPDPSAGGMQRVDDLWHAAVNGRGTFFSAKDPSSLSQGLATALNSIQADVFNAVAPSFASPVLSDNDNVAYVASYRNGSWTGRVEAKLINPDTGDLLTTPPIWRAHNILDAAVLADGGTGWSTRRRIAVGNGAGGAVPFRWASLPIAHQNVLADGKDAAYGEKLLNYLRGDKSNEGSAGSKLFRPRGDDLDGDPTIGILGDIINSRPIVLGKATSRYSEDYHEGYNDFVALVKNRKPVVYVNSNDGMLHAFDATSAGSGISRVATADSGKELWAYIPGLLMHSGTDEDGRKNGLQSYAYVEGGTPPFRKHYLNDATPTVFDADLGHTGGVKGAKDWRSILISGLNKGGRGYFALDVTNGGAVTTEAEAASKFLWEFKGDADMGYSFGQATVSWLKNQGWVVIVPSGYNNSTGNGAIWILNAKTGAVIKKFTISATGCGDNSCFAVPGIGPGNPLNLGSLATFVTSADEERLWSIYAADMQGNVWRMDVSDDNMNNWKIVKLAELDRNTAPTGVYGTTRQPVTVNPAIAWDSAADARWIFIGTGLDQSKLDRDDLVPQASQVQSMYAIRDGKALAPLTGAELPVKRDKMVAVNRAGTDEVVMPSDKRGWYMDLAPFEAASPANRLAERVVLQPSAALGQVIFASTVPTKDLCTPGNIARVYARSYLAGKEGRSFLQNSGGSRVAYIELMTGAAASPRLVQLKGGKIVLQTADVKGSITNVGLENADVSLQSKTSWRELIPD